MTFALEHAPDRAPRHSVERLARHHLISFTRLVCKSSR